ncbi:IS4 family transposase [Thalassotalea euphylliae]|uniref:IS4 family transposase n=2 Tax=Thalassotalea euphylliae TaxID=1655234 RepID=A0A3E0TNJ4_9GAMM|nr:IS4 family transposase [Thalassotalea euphylliae]
MVAPLSKSITQHMSLLNSPFGLRNPQKVTGITICDLIESPNTIRTTVMPVKSLCHNYFKNTLSSFNRARMKTLMLSADALIDSNRLTLTDIGRHLEGKAFSKNKIKRIDRFLNNDHLQRELIDIYRALAKPVISQLPYLVIAVDWSGCCGSNYHLLRASLLVDGRSMTLYNMVVEEKDKETRTTHQLFLSRLSHILAGHAKVYITSDGGFLTPWYAEVLAHGWDFIGRLRGTMKCQLKQQPTQWQTLAQLRKDASCTPKNLGSARLTQHSKTGCQASLHLYQGEHRGRRGKSRFTKDDKMYRNLAHEPWLIATSDAELTSREVINLYAKRMQIEQNFRDDKSEQYGFSWRFSRTMGIKRMSILCLIACVASLVLWLIGFEAERRKWHFRFQANTVRKRRVLSFLSLAKNIVKQCPHQLTKRFIKRSWLNFILEFN